MSIRKMWGSLKNTNITYNYINCSKYLQHMYTEGEGTTACNTCITVSVITLHMLSSQVEYSCESSDCLLGINVKYR